MTTIVGRKGRLRAALPPFPLPPAAPMEPPTPAPGLVSPGPGSREGRGQESARVGLRARPQPSQAQHPGRCGGGMGAERGRGLLGP